MNLKLAATEDLPLLKAEYQKITDHMNQAGIRIWDDVYPCEFLESDIRKNRFYVLEDQGKMVSAFALCETNAGENDIIWENSRARALYLDRFGVSIDCLRKGVGSAALHQAIELAGEKGAEYLRLFVVDTNRPAIGLYLKNGFKKGSGIYHETIEEGLTFRELGFEIKTRS